jgi:hypothetical protein
MMSLLGHALTGMLFRARAELGSAMVVIRPVNDPLGHESYGVQVAKIPGGTLAGVDEHSIARI